MIKWEHISDILKNKEYEKLIRDEKMSEKYNNYKKTLTDKIENIIHNKYFHEKKLARRNGYVINDRFVIASNDFPYNFEEGINHYVLWLNPKYNKLSLEEVEILCHNLFDFDVYVHETPLYLRSIKKIQHYHIFTKNTIDTLID